MKMMMTDPEGYRVPSAEERVLYEQAADILMELQISSETEWPLKEVPTKVRRAVLEWHDLVECYGARTGPVFCLTQKGRLMSRDDVVQLLEPEGTC
jgi:hypothetical protein